MLIHEPCVRLRKEGATTVWLQSFFLFSNHETTTCSNPHGILRSRQTYRQFPNSHLRISVLKSIFDIFQSVLDNESNFPTSFHRLVPITLRLVRESFDSGRWVRLTSQDRFSRSCPWETFIVDKGQVEQAQPELAPLSRLDVTSSAKSFKLFSNICTVVSGSY